MITLRVASFFALSVDRRQRWRQASLILGGFAAGLAVLAAVGLMHAGKIASDHSAARSPAVALSSTDDVRLLMSARAITIEGFGQVPVHWLQPVAGHDNDPLSIPPGLTRLPGPGEAVLSPGLLRAGISAGDLGLRTSQAGNRADGSIGDAGLISRSEGFVYARPPTNRSLGEGGALIPLVGYTPSQASVPVELNPDVLLFPAAALGALWMLLIPAGYLLFGCARASSPVRERRANLLWRLGVSTGRIRRLVAVESALLVAAGVTAALVVWLTVGSHATSFPLNSSELLPGAFRPPVWCSLLAGLAVILLAAIVSASARVVPRPTRVSGRRFTSLHLLPLILALIAMAISPLISGDLGLAVLFGGLLLSLLALPAVIPMLASALAHRMSGRSRPTTWLAGKRLALRAGNVSRPAVVTAALVFMAGSAFALFDGLLTAPGEFIPDGPRSVWSVNWRDSKVDDVAAIRAQAPDEVIVGAVSGEATNGLDGIPTSLGSVSFPSCEALRAFMDDAELACDGSGNLFGYQTQVGPAASDTYEVLVGAPRGTDEMDVVQLFEGLPAVNPSQLMGPTNLMDPGALWVRTGWAAAAGLLVVATVREIGDRTITSLQSQSRMLRAGLTTREARATDLIASLTPIAISIPVGYVCAVLFALRGYGRGLTGFNLSALSVVCLLVGSSAALLIVAIHAWQQRSDDQVI
ncbi:hypothetical protein [Ornithinimicrobium murale]|uniref:hypothetical protein n=1 Tax=Ornithinimicrobium murale TaxID=1050153 RepID=UPI0013B3627E|nr:hypothetical protein [Ornithinimicrobium murale]